MNRNRKWALAKFEKLSADWCNQGLKFVSVATSERAVATQLTVGLHLLMLDAPHEPSTAYLRVDGIGS